MIPFVKMESLGNDIILLPQESLLEKSKIQRLAHRHYGIGCDQVMMLGSMLRIWNQDGSSAQACGNGTRCVVAYLHPPMEQKITFQGPAGPLVGWRSRDGRIHVQQGVAHVGVIQVHDRRKIMPTLALQNFQDGLEGVPVDVGNPHLVIMIHPPEPSSPLWPSLSSHPAFPQGVNVSFVNPNPGSLAPLQVTTWERNVGFTLGCGSAACAVAAVLLAQGEARDTLSLQMKGGEITVTRNPNGLLVHAATATLIGHGWWSGNEQSMV